MKWQTLLITLLASLVLAGCAGPESALRGNDYYAAPKEEFQFGKLKYLSKSKRIIVPHVTVKLQNWGQQGAVAQTGGFLSSGSTQTAQASAEVTVAVEPALAQELATALHQDLVTQLRNKGWEVLTLDDIQGLESYQKLKWEKGSDLGQGIDSEKSDGKVLGVGFAGGSGTGYYNAVPAGQPFLKYSSLTGPGWAMRKVAKEADANLLIPTYYLHLVSFDANSDKSLFGNRVKAGVEVYPVLTLANAQSIYLNPKLAGSTVFLTGKGMGQASEVPVGSIVSSKDTSPKLANALGAAFRALGASGIQRSASEYVMEPDTQAVKQEAIKLGQAYNDIITRAASLYLPGQDTP